MSLQNKKAKCDVRPAASANNTTNRTNNSEQQDYTEPTEDCYFIDNIDDIDTETVETSRTSITKVTNKRRKRATKLPTSFVWKYFKKGENSISATCHVIGENGTECGHYYNDRSTTSNLIHHLAIKHKIYKLGSVEEVIFIKIFK